MDSMNLPPRRPLIPCLPDALLDDHMAVVEVLIQEGFHSFGVPIGSDALADLVRVFGARATFWATRIATADDVRHAVEAGITRLLADDAPGELVDEATRVGAEIWASAMTATEIRAVLRLPVAGAVLWPADVVGHSLASRLAEVGLATAVIPMGGVGAYAAGEWLAAGSPAVCVDSALLGDAYQGGSLSKLRERCGAFVAVQARHAEADAAAS